MLSSRVGPPRNFDKPKPQVIDLTLDSSDEEDNDDERYEMSPRYSDDLKSNLYWVRDRTWIGEGISR